jgi:hypothetical protein
MEPRTLTHDERKAAEAAFRGEPFDPKWSPAARLVYDGIANTTGADSAPLITDHSAEPTGTAEAPVGEAPMKESGPAPGSESAEGRASSEAAGPIHSDQSPADQGSGGVTPPVTSRAEAIKEGLLIDVTQEAASIGLPHPVGITKPLWDIGVTASNTLTVEQHQARVRDILLALRLHLSVSPLVSPVIQFPALLSFPPDPVPQVCLLCAVVHKDKTNPHALTVVLPNEISTMFSSFSN